LSQIVASKIEDAVRGKKFLPGDKLPSEIELCAQFNVSRTAIREALRTLSAKGLIRVMKGKGIFVLESSPDLLADQMHLYLEMNVKPGSVLDIVHARQIIEPPIAALAALNHTGEDEKILLAGLEEFQACDGPITLLARLDMKFHLDIAKASRNTIMPLILEPIHKLMPEIKSSVYATNADARESALIWHRKILDAILRRDAEAARTTMTEHLQIAEHHAGIMLEAKRLKGSGNTLQRSIEE